jgi:hypothetical protein
MQCRSGVAAIFSLPYSNLHPGLGKEGRFGLFYTFSIGAINEM